MNASFTPGPWTYTDESGGSFYIRDNKGSQLIWLGDSSRFEPGENEANAALIAAAPGLLNALQNLVAPFDNGGAFGGEEWGYNRKFAVEARAAISKALRQST